MKIKKEKREETFYRVTPCCGNCSFFGYYKGNQRRGVCYHDIDLPEAYYNKDMYDKYPRTHATCTCDNHKLRSKKRTQANIKRWCGGEFLED